MFLVVNAGNVVAAVALPNLRVPPVRLSVPVEVIWYPPSSNMLAKVTSPIVRVFTVVAPPKVTPAALFILRVTYVVPFAVWLEEPL